MKQSTINALRHVWLGKFNGKLPEYLQKTLQELEEGKYEY